LEEINTILKTFETIDLKEMDKVKLMDRTDTKFTFSFDRLADILKEVNPFYKILSVENALVSRYETLYYDTADLYLYHKHHVGHLNRFKIRHRTYVESNIGFLEVKFKNNKGRTIKQRISKNEVPLDWEGDTEAFLSLKTPYEPKSLVPVIWINYNRLTLVNRTSTERLTIDLDLEFLKDEKMQRFHNLVIAEVKQEGKYPSPFSNLMKKLHIREGSISKYCMGIAMTYDHVKTNNFKPKLLNLKEIIKNDTIANSRR